MEIVIKIHDTPQNDHERWVLKNGTPLPKGHGRLIDKDKMMRDLLTVDSQYQDLIDWCLQVTEAQPTIIESDGGNEDEANN